jgi:hypothetical protein
MPFTSRKKKSEYDARYRASHREYILKCKIEWYAAHRKENAEKCKQYAATHRKEIAEEKAQYYAAHHKEARKVQTVYRATHRAELAWSNMHRRCNNPVGRSAAYVGVRVCRRWSGPKGKANFLSDMGPRPAGTSLSRFADTGDYKKSNCAWHTPEQQRAEARKKLSNAKEHYVDICR